MKILNTKTITPALSLLVLAGSANAAITLGQQIGVNVTDNSESSPANWTNITSFFTTVGALDLATGSSITGVNLELTRSRPSDGNPAGNITTLSGGTVVSAPTNVVSTGGFASGGSEVNSIILSFTGLETSLQYNVELYSLHSGGDQDAITITGGQEFDTFNGWGSADLDSRGERGTETTGVFFNNLVTDGSGNLVFSVNQQSNPVFSGIRLTAVPVPEPSSAALLGLSGLALILRRRK